MTTHRIGLRILDHQVVGPDDEMLGNVDDLELVVSEAGWLVTALQVGPAALGGRLPGPLGRWTVAIWRRLQTSPDPHAARVGLEDVRDIGSAITVNRSASTALAASFGLERWLRQFVVSRIPGAKGGGDERDEAMPADGSGASGPGASGPGASGPGASGPGGPAVAPAPAPASGATTASSVIGARVFADDGSELGVVLELLCAEPGVGRARDHLRVTHVEYGHHRAGCRLGYDADARQGPLVVGAVVRWWQRDHRVAPVEDVVGLDLGARTLKVAASARHVHPHEL